MHARLRRHWTGREVPHNLRKHAVNDRRIRQPAYDIVNASVALAAFDDRWRVVLAARNLLDETYAVANSHVRDPFASGVIVNEPGRFLFMRLSMEY